MCPLHLHFAAPAFTFLLQDADKEADTGNVCAPRCADSAGRAMAGSFLIRAAGFLITAGGHLQSNGWAPQRAMNLTMAMP
jgi:hypothetical protein